jgi:hypothetical protein
MKTEQIEQRLQDINNEIYFLDGLRDAHDDTNIHEIEYEQEVLINERHKLISLLDSFFDEMIGL